MNLENLFENKKTILTPQEENQYTYFRNIIFPAFRISIPICDAAVSHAVSDKELSDPINKPF